MKKILLSNHYEGKALEILSNAVGNHFELEVLKEANSSCLEKQIIDADYLLVSGRVYISREALMKANKLKMIQRTGVGLDNMDLQYIHDQNLPLYVNQGVNANSVAEHTLLLILSCLRNSYMINKNVRKGIWEKQITGLTTHTLEGKTVGIIGAGQIGRRVMSLIKAFNANIIYYDPYRLKEETENELGIKYVEFNELIQESDIISLHCPYLKEQGSIINKKEIDLMKDDAIIVNTSRGKLINQTDLVNALKEDKFLGIGLDVFEKEPIDNQDLFAFDNVILSPHIAGVTYEAFSDMMIKAVNNIIKYDEGKLKEIENKLYITSEGKI